MGILSSSSGCRNPAVRDGWDRKKAQHTIRLVHSYQLQTPGKSSVGDEEEIPWRKIWGSAGGREMRSWQTGSDPT
eukprot:CAMPEP_0184679732 /NCGR_PEP_ID=MMETSP0312-20130426/2587_1 /TAXON_ID=31354 /ORGANISM="Compsopogon coeruleus, Strain SAG 36.94" /LENGTH=74 /DNA_ID=CAMNT_0027129369 /DNA_START=545 /DNA_END=769 /DNA_ORIENTATION=+